MAEEGIEIGFEEGMLWLPTHVLREACDAKEYLSIQRHQRNGHRLNSFAEPLLPQPKSSMKPHYRQRRPTNWGAGGSGMQAIFLDHSGRRSCGTGVFLPQPSKKPACSPVLLPSRVVQALNLNVHELGLQVKSPRDTNNDPKSLARNGISNIKKNQDAQYGANSPEIFLPKEWTY